MFKRRRNITQRICFEKWLAIGIILLFTTTGFSPVIASHTSTIVSKSISIPQKEDDVSITVFEYRLDGTIGKSEIKMPQGQVDKFQEELKGIKKLETRLSIYKKYHLIPQNVTASILQLGMKEKAQRTRLTEDKLEHMTENNRTLFPTNGYRDYFCKVRGQGDTSVWGLYLLIPFGTTLITFLINSYNWGPVLKGIDVLDYIIGDINFESVGKLGSYGPHNLRGIIKMVGFVGYAWSYYGHNMDFIEAFDGFAVYVAIK